MDVNRSRGNDNNSLDYNDSDKRFWLSGPHKGFDDFCRNALDSSRFSVSRAIFGNVASALHFHRIILHGGRGD